MPTRSHMGQATKISELQLHARGGEIIVTNASSRDIDERRNISSWDEKETEEAVLDSAPAAVQRQHALAAIKRAGKYQPRTTEHHEMCHELTLTYRG